MQPSELIDYVCIYFLLNGLDFFVFIEHSGNFSSPTCSPKFDHDISSALVKREVKYSQMRTLIRIVRHNDILTDIYEIPLLSFFFMDYSFTEYHSDLFVS